MVSARLAARTCNGRATGSQPKPPTEDKMQFNQTTCAACGGTLEALWEKIAKRMEADHANR